MQIIKSFLLFYNSNKSYSMSIDMKHTKERIEAFREAYNKALFDMVYADTNDADYARKYVEEHPAGYDESLAYEMQHEPNAANLADLEYRFD